MKTGIAKFDAGICLNPNFSPVDQKDGRMIKKGKEWILLDTYDFNYKYAIFTEKKTKGDK